jgi:hypothetical protein
LQNSFRAAKLIPHPKQQTADSRMQVGDGASAEPLDEPMEALAAATKRVISSEENTEDQQKRQKLYVQFPLSKYTKTHFFVAEQSKKCRKKEKAETMRRTKILLKHHSVVQGKIQNLAQLIVF